jgi:ribulose-5-phosphate 4-epimerase/fuculose-1-phosphate aldolase
LKRSGRSRPPIKSTVPLDAGTERQNGLRIQSGEPGASAAAHFDYDDEAVRQARIDLAACFRMAARLGLQEGICNHFSFMLPGSDDLFLVNPYGLAFEEITPSSLLIGDFAGNVVPGEGKPEATAFYIHARLHMSNPRIRAAFHTHMPYATALTMVEGDPLVWAGQTALKFSDALR